MYGFRGFGRGGDCGHGFGFHQMAGHGRFGSGGRGGGRFESRAQAFTERLLGHGDLRYVILSLLEKKASHGYELIKSLEELSSGMYSPSPGAIYPTLTFLEEGGFATTSTEETKKLYTITPEGVALLDENRDFVEAILKKFSKGGEKLSKLKQWMGREEEGPGRSWGDRSSIRRTMHELRHELFHFLDAGKDEKQKLADILEKAVAQIRKLREDVQNDKRGQK